MVLTQVSGRAKQPSKKTVEAMAVLEERWPSGGVLPRASERQSLINSRAMPGARVVVANLTHLFCC